MLGLPQPGESVTFRISEGHRVPMVGRKGKVYPAGQDITERWTQEHHGRHRAGALLLVKWSGMPRDGSTESSEEIGS